MRVAIHQPEYLPWLGLIDRARRADVFVLLDDVQFNRASLQHRARIWTGRGLSWLTIPFVHAFPQRIDQVRVADPAWTERHATALMGAYKDAPGFRSAWGRLAPLYSARHNLVAEAAIASMRVLFDAFGARPLVVRSSALDVPGAKGERVLGLCRRLGATHYLCGATAAREYLDHEAFADAGVGVEVQEFVEPPDPRWTPGQARGLSAVDGLMRLGDHAVEVFG